ncbi:MAG TPA: GAF domain-containing protein, partial [Dehalococcoidia bacterium]|nr:GAF domain-containing protein [Dehalococcoidia bacterium]
MTSRSFVPVLDGGDTRLAALARLTARIAACQDQEGVLDAIAAGVVEELSVALVRIWLHDPSDDVLRLRAEVGATGDRSGVLRTLSMRDTAAPVVQAVARHEAVVLDEIDVDGGFDDPDQLRREGLRASAAFPLTVGDRAVGAIVAFLRTAWPPDLLAALGALAPQAALALEHARLRDEAHTFQRIAADLASAHDTSRFLEGLVQRVMAVQGADACAVWMLDEDGHL